MEETNRKRGPYKKKSREPGTVTETENRTGFPEFGERIKLRLLELNKTQDELAEAIGMSKGSVSSYINGTQLPPSSCLPALANFLGLSIDYLFGLNSLSRVDESYKSACAVTGLSPEAIDTLVQLCRLPGMARRSLDQLLSSNAGANMFVDLEEVLFRADVLKEAKHRFPHEFSQEADKLRLALFEYSESALKAAKTVFQTEELLDKYNRIKYDGSMVSAAYTKKFSGGSEPTEEYTLEEMVKLLEVK